MQIYAYDPSIVNLIPPAGKSSKQPVTQLTTPKNKHSMILFFLIFNLVGTTSQLILEWN